MSGVHRCFTLVGDKCPLSTHSRHWGVRPGPIAHAASPQGRIMGSAFS
jgi:hypothetical protein